MDLFPTHARVPQKRRLIKTDQCWARRDLAGKLVVGDVQVSETALVEARDGSCERVILQVKHVETPELEQRRRDIAGESVARQNYDFDTVETGDGGWEVAGEVVIVEKYGFEIDQGREVRDWTRQ